MEITKKSIKSGIMCAAAVCLTIGSSFGNSLYAAETYKVSVSVNTLLDRKSISPYIYGINDTVIIRGDGFTAIKQGSPELSTYNWENNCSNSGTADFNTNSSAIPDRYGLDSSEPAAAIRGLMSIADAGGIDYRVTTVPMLGYVAADAGGPILDGEEAPSDRWKEIVPYKNDDFILHPDTNDDVVYMDEYINYIVKKYGKASQHGVDAYCLGSDPVMWTTLNPYAAKSLSLAELIDRTKSTAMAIKSVDDSAVVIGGGFRDIESCVSFGNNAEWESKKGEYNWFVDYYLDRLSAAGEQSGKRLVDAIDVNYYPDVITEDGELIYLSTSDEANKLRVQATRALWDSTYSDNSAYKQYYPFLPTVQASINEYYPGTKLAMTEYNFGGGSDISGAIAQIDILGSFAQEGIYLACLNPNENESIRYQLAAINLFTNYDGNGAGFGNTIVRSHTSDNQNSSVFSALDEEGKLQVILVNKSENMTQNIELDINSDVEYTSAEVYGFDAGSSLIKGITNYGLLKGNMFSYKLLPESVVIISFDYVKSDETLIETEETEVTEKTTQESTTVLPETEFTSSAASEKTPETTNDTVTAKEDRRPMIFFKVGAILFGTLTAVGLIYLFAGENRNLKITK